MRKVYTFHYEEYLNILKICEKKKLKIGKYSYCGLSGEV